MLSLHVLSLALQFGVPVILLGWLARGRDASVAQWLTKTGIVLLYLAAVHVAGLWVLLPWYTAFIFGLAVLAIVLWRIHSIRRLPWSGPRTGWRSIAGRLAITLFAVTVLVLAGVGRRLPPETVVDLEFPLRNGVYYVVGGGSVELVNSHVMTLTDDRFRAYRGQSYGVDVLRLDAYGRRASGPLPVDPSQYAIYGDSVYAPCSGRVVDMHDGAPDMAPPQPDRTRMAGNHVLLDCQGFHVLLAHLQPGTVRVAHGEQVQVGALIGLVGNSGNSNEPHLHIHAQRPAPAGHEPLSGDPLPIRFNGRYLVRNDRVQTLP